MSPALSALPPCGPLTRLKIYDPLPKKSRSKSGLFVLFRVWLCFVRRAIDIVSLAFPPPPSGYEPDEVRAYRNRLLIGFSSNGLHQDALTRLLEWRLDRGFNCFEGRLVAGAGFEPAAFRL